MSNQQIITYANLAIQFLNDKLNLPAQMLQNALSLKMDTFPQILKSPFNFTAAMIFLLFIIIGYANNLICSLIGVIYPIIYGLDLFNANPVDTDKLVLLNKYWILFAGIHLLDSIFGFILGFLPGYFYLKISLIYSLIRNDFALSGKFFSMLENIYVNSGLYPKIEMLMSYVKAKINTNKSSSTKNSAPNNTPVEQNNYGNIPTIISNKTSDVPIEQKNTNGPSQSSETVLNTNQVNIENEQDDEPSEELDAIDHGTANSENTN